MTDVVLTHMHMDHLGGLLIDGVKDRLRPDFCGSTSQLPSSSSGSSPDFSRAVMPAGFPDALRRAAKRFVNDYGSQLRPFEEEHEVTPGVVVRRTGGHTPGHSVVRLASGGGPADVRRVTPCFRSGSINLSGIMASSTTPKRRPASASKLLRELAANRELLVATHLPFPSLSHVAVDGDTFRCVPIVWDY